MAPVRLAGTAAAPARATTARVVAVAEVLAGSDSGEKIGLAVPNKKLPILPNKAMKGSNNKNKYPVVFIVYRDIVLWEGQCKINSGFPLHIFHVAGFLIEDNNDNYVISREIVTNQNDDLRGAMTIPKAVVTYFKKIA